MMQFILRWLPSFAPAIGPLLNPWVLLAFVAYTGVVAGFSGFKGFELGEAKYHKLVGEVAAARVAFVQKVVKVAGEVRVQWLQAETKIVDRHHIIEKEVINVPSRAECNSTAGWVRVHDAATDRSGSDVERAVDDARDSGITEAQTLAVVVRNYRSFHQVANDLEACRAAWRGVAKE